MKEIPLYEFEGQGFELGFAYGKTLESRIRACYEFYRAAFSQLSDDELKQISSRYAASIKRFSARYAEEIRGIGQGSALDEWKIVVLNVRTEILNLIQGVAGECTTICSARDRILAQNWDWAERIGELMILVLIKRPDGHKIVQLAEPGIIGKIGMNSKGLAVGLNILAGPSVPERLPVHVLLRSALEQETAKQASELISNSPLGTSSSISLLDRSGDGVILEIEGEEVYRLESCMPLIHTNHYLARSCNGELSFFKDSFSRFEQTQKLLGELRGSVLSIENISEILLNRENSEYPIFAPPTEFGQLGKVGTLASIILRPDVPSMHINKASHSGSFACDWQVVSLTD